MACQFCTFINERGSSICNACGRSLGLPPVNLNPSGIECVQCTFKNRLGTVNCGMCGMALSQLESVNLSTIPEQSCQICYCQMSEEFRMPGCTHIFCSSCAKQFFTYKVCSLFVCSIGHIMWSFEIILRSWNLA